MTHGVNVWLCVCIKARVIVALSTNNPADLILLPCFCDSTGQGASAVSGTQISFFCVLFFTYVHHLLVSLVWHILIVVPVMSISEHGCCLFVHMKHPSFVSKII
jgi:hypothetical protein